MDNKKMNREVVPEGFTISMALVDLLPVLFFAGASIVLGLMLNSVFMYIGGAISFIGGLIKVIWKLIVVLKRKNIWWMFVQMRITMPVGFIFMIIGFIISCVTIDIRPFFISIANPFVIILLAMGFIGMTLMIVFSVKLDSSDAKSNWIEQICNSISQFSFFLAFLLAFLL